MDTRDTVFVETVKLSLMLDYLRDTVVCVCPPWEHQKHQRHVIFDTFMASL